MYLSKEISDLFDKNLKVVANKFRPANGTVLSADDAETPFREILKEYSISVSGKIQNNFIDQRVNAIVNKDKSLPNDIRLSSIIMFALDFYSRPILMNKGYSEEDAYNLWSIYMPERGDEVLFNEISDFDGSNERLK
jgi:hypothetical protein